MSAAPYNERVQFRLFAMPCCGYQLCWVNPRLPSHCPECGSSVLAQLRTEAHTIMHSPAWLRVDGAPKPSSVQCPHCFWGFDPSVIRQHIREKHGEAA